MYGPHDLLRSLPTITVIWFCDPWFIHFSQLGSFLAYCPSCSIKLLASGSSIMCQSSSCSMFSWLTLVPLNFSLTVLVPKHTCFLSICAATPNYSLLWWSSSKPGINHPLPERSWPFPPSYPALISTVYFIFLSDFFIQFYFPPPQASPRSLSSLARTFRSLSLRSVSALRMPFLLTELVLLSTLERPFMKSGLSLKAQK